MAVKIEIDPHSGFCFGVTRAIQLAEDALRDQSAVASLGSIVHNQLEVERLLAKGLKVITPEEYQNTRDTQVLFRAHGEPAYRYQEAKAQNITLIDATCPVVLKLQQRIRKAYEQCLVEGGQVVIYGKAGHAEVVGLEGQTEFTARVLQGGEDLSGIDFTQNIHLFSQTTQSIAGFEQLAQQINEQAQKDVHIHDTICRQVSNRGPRIQAFARDHEQIVFVGGSQSSNAKVLFGICKAENPNSLFISDKAQLQNEQFTGVQSIGICGATSTPMWQMAEVAALLNEWLNP